MTDEQATVGTLPPPVAQLLTVSGSYWPGLFPCDDVTGLPRTNHDLEQDCGSARYQQRRASFRKNPAAYLATLEATLLKESLLSEEKKRPTTYSRGRLRQE